MAFAVPAVGWALWLVAVAAGTGALIRSLRSQGTSTVSVQPAIDMTAIYAGESELL